jgi:hypothetical protein
VTKETKHFIDPSDILSVRLQCKHHDCHATLMLPVSSPIDIKRFYTCPHCNRGWLRASNQSIEMAVQECISKIEELKHQLENFPGEFDLSLEIKLDAE